MSDTIPKTPLYYFHNPLKYLQIICIFRDFLVCLNLNFLSILVVKRGLLATKNIKFGIIFLLFFCLIFIS